MIRFGLGIFVGVITGYVFGYVKAYLFLVEDHLEVAKTAERFGTQLINCMDMLG